MADKIDSILNSSTAALIGIIMLASVVIPVGVSQISGLTGDAAEYAPLLSVVIMMAIVGLIIGVVRYFGGSKE